MPVSHLEHFLIQTDDIERTCDWYVRVLGFRVGPSPDFRFPVKWLYLGEQDVIHVCEGGAAVSEARKRYLGQQSEDLRGSGVIDHVAFRCTGLDEMIARLKAAAVEFNERQVDDQALYQLFLLDPNGVKVELNFAASEAAGRRAAVTAADLPA
jgi:catechol 2,3-dioxygenase-like lactoylglutathione lyase family enzyme